MPIKIQQNVFLSKLTLYTKTQNGKSELIFFFSTSFNSAFRQKLDPIPMLNFIIFISFLEQTLDSFLCGACEEITQKCEPQIQAWISKISLKRTFSTEDKKQ